MKTPKQKQNIFILAGCLLVAGVALGFFIFKGISNLITDSPVFELVQKKVDDSPIVQTEIGKVKGFEEATGNLNLDGQNKKAKLTYTILGSKAKGVIQATASKKNNQWHLDTLTLTTKQQTKKTSHNLLSRLNFIDGYFSFERWGTVLAPEDPLRFDKNFYFMALIQGLALDKEGKYNFSADLSVDDEKGQNIFTHKDILSVHAQPEPNDPTLNLSFEVLLASQNRSAGEYLLTITIYDRIDQTSLVIARKFQIQ